MASPQKARVRRMSYRAEFGLAEIDLLMLYARTPRSVEHLADDLVQLGWPASEALELALIAARLLDRMNLSTLTFTALKGERTGG